jgi:hypothetical protein
VDHEVVAVHLVTRRRCRSHEAARAAVVDEHEGVPGEGCALGAGPGVERGDVGGKVDDRPVPEAARGRRVGVVAGDHVALGALRSAAPRQLRGLVAELRDLVVLEGLPVGDVLAGDGERRDLGEKLVRVGLHGAVETHLLSSLADVDGPSQPTTGRHRWLRRSLCDWPSVVEEVALRLAIGG